MLTGKETKTELTIYEFCKNNPQKCYNSTITDLASYCFTTAATISKYIAKSEFCNFFQFREYFYKNFYIDKKILDTDILNFEKRINKSIKSIRMNDIKTLAKKIDEAEEIIIFGVGTSGDVCKYLKNNMLKLHYKVIYESNPDACKSQLMIRKNSIMIILSHSGNTDEVRTLLESIHNKPLTFGITSNDKSFLANKCDSLVAYTDYTECNSAFASISLIIQSAVCDLLLEELSNYNIVTSKFNSKKLGSTLLY